MAKKKYDFDEDYEAFVRRVRLLGRDTDPLTSTRSLGLYYIANELADLNENIKELTKTVKSANKQEETGKKILLEEYTDKGKAASSSSLEEKVK